MIWSENLSIGDPNEALDGVEKHLEVRIDQKTILRKNITELFVND